MKKTSVLSKNDEIQLEIDALTSQGSGVGHFEGMAVFVEGTVTGDRVLAHIILVKKNYAVATVKKIIKPSKHRIAPDCEVSVSCGGCSYRHIEYPYELEIKKQRVQDALNRIGALDVEVEEILHGEKTDRYRNKAQYPIGLSPQGKTQIGFYAKKSHRIVDCRNCALQPQEFTNILKTIEKWAAESGVSLYDESTEKGLLRHIYLRKGSRSKETMVCLVVTKSSIPKAKNLIDSLLAADSSIASIVLNVNNKATNVVLSNECITLYGKDYIEDELCSLRFRLSPLSFYQVNCEGAEILYKTAKQYAALTGEETLLDLYCGTGTIGLTMADSAKKVIGVEIIPQAIENAKQNAVLNGITNAEFFCDDASGAAKRFAEGAEKIDVIILDPPRKGCDKAVIDAVVKMNPKRVVYISCDSATQARDCAIFKEKGYEIDKATAVDMFPRTVHVESIALLSQH